MMLEKYIEQISLKEENEKLMELLKSPEDPELKDKIKELEEIIEKLKELNLSNTSTYVRSIDELSKLKDRLKIKSNKQLILELVDNLNCQLNISLVSDEYFITNFLEKVDCLKNYTGEIDIKLVNDLHKLKKWIERNESIDYISILNKNNELLGNTHEYYEKTEFFYSMIDENNFIVFQYFPLGIIIYKN